MGQRAGRRLVFATVNRRCCSARERQGKDSHYKKCRSLGGENNVGGINVARELHNLIKKRLGRDEMTLDWKIPRLRGPQLVAALKGNRKQRPAMELGVGALELLPPSEGG